MAIASMAVSIGSFFICFGFLGFVGAILGHVARRQIRERGGDGDGMALAGIIIGWVGFGISLLVGLAYVGMFAWIASHEPANGPDYGDAIRGLLAHWRSR